MNSWCPFGGGFGPFSLSSSARPSHVECSLKPPMTEVSISDKPGKSMLEYGPYSPGLTIKGHFFLNGFLIYLRWSGPCDGVCDMQYVSGGMAKLSSCPMLLQRDEPGNQGDHCPWSFGPLWSISGLRGNEWRKWQRSSLMWFRVSYQDNEPHSSEWKSSNVLEHHWSPNLCLCEWWQEQVWRRPPIPMVWGSQGIHDWFIQADGDCGSRIWRG